MYILFPIAQVIFKPVPDHAHFCMAVTVDRFIGFSWIYLDFTKILCITCWTIIRLFPITERYCLSAVRFTQKPLVVIQVMLIVH